MPGVAGLMRYSISSNVQRRVSRQQSYCRSYVVGRCRRKSAAWPEQDRISYPGCKD